MLPFFYLLITLDFLLPIFTK